MSYKKKELLNLREQFHSPSVSWFGPCCSLFYVVLLCVFTFGVACYDVCYDFRIHTMDGSFLSPAVCRIHVLFTLVVCCHTHIGLCFCFVCLRFVSRVPNVTSFICLSIFGIKTCMCSLKEINIFSTSLACPVLISIYTSTV